LIDDAELLEQRVEMWKQTVETQQHFNDLELRIRNLCVTLVGAMFGAVGLSAKNAVNVQLLGQPVPFAALIACASIPIIGAFWLMDRGYHRLLYAAVEHGRAIERKLEALVPESGLAERIKALSPIPFFGNKFDSRMRLDTFYFLLVCIAVLALTGLIAPDARWLGAALCVLSLVYLARLMHCDAIN
jgi:cobalamin synthase